MFHFEPFTYCKNIAKPKINLSSLFSLSSWSSLILMSPDENGDLSKENYKLNI